LPRRRHLSAGLFWCKPRRSFVFRKGAAIPSSPALVIPAAAHLPAYRAALARGWSPDNVRAAAAAEQAAAIDHDAAAFLAALDDPDARGPPIVLPDGSQVPRLPGIIRWIWNDGFCGSVGFRWQPGGAALPPHVLGHMGFAVVPWRRRQGHASAGLALMLPEARKRGLPYVELTTMPDNPGSQAVIIANGGRLVERFERDAAYGGGTALKYRISL
jgi:predicted acetyltransferase